MEIDTFIIFQRKYYDAKSWFYQFLLGRKIKTLIDKKANCDFFENYDRNTKCYYKELDRTPGGELPSFEEHRHDQKPALKILN